MRTGQALRRSLHRIVLIGVTVGTWATGAGANGPCGYDVTIIQAGDCPPFGPQATIGTAVNDLGQIVGYYCQCFCGNGDEAFFWDGSTFTTLPRLPGFRAARAYGMNDHGWLVGSMTEANIDLNHAVFWQNGQPLDLGIPPGGNFSQAFSVNARGQIAGVWGNNVTGDPGKAAFLWQDGRMMNLELPMGPNSAALDMNANGEVVGWMGSSFLIDSHAFIWENGVVTDLGIIPGGLTSSANAINDGGQVVGWGSVPEPGFLFGVTRAFRWTDGQMIHLGVIPDHLFSAAAAINNAGQVVGQSWYVDGSPNVSHGFIWQDGVMTNVDTLIPAGLNLNVTVANAINDQGQITGVANSPQGVVAVLLSPIGPSAADVNGDGVVNVLDLIELLLCFGQPPTPPCDAPDTNQDGVVNVLDLINLLLDFGITCHKQ